MRLKLSFTILLFCALVFVSKGQVTSETAPDQNGNNEAPGINDLQLRPIRLPGLQEVGGSPFMKNEYVLGIVQVSPEKTILNVPVKFNIFNNAVMVQKDGQDLKLESFELVTYYETGNLGEIKYVNFKKGYPEIDNHTGANVYQVLAFGPKLHLLKYLSQKVEDAPTLGDYSRREIVTTQQLYIYIPGGEIKRIKTGKKSIIEALPSMALEIEEAIKAGDLSMKSENDLIELVKALNK